MTKVLLLDTKNSHEHKNPYATLCDVPTQLTVESIKEIEYAHPNMSYWGRVGGSRLKLMEAISNGVDTGVSSGRLEDYTEDEYDISYTVISGNY